MHSGKVKIKTKYRIMLSNTCKYAIRAVIYLGINCKDDQKIGIKQISSDLSIPTPFLGKILQNLVRCKLLTSTKGPHGGFGIERDLSSISLYDIIIIIDGDNLFETCLIGMKPCKKNLDDAIVPCPVHEKFSALRSSMRTYFEGETIASIISRMGTSNEYIEL